jgi:CubicO group peptidase (beta-lactamase class C family)
MSSARRGSLRDMIEEILDAAVRDGRLPGGVALVAKGGDVVVHAAGFADVEAGTSIQRDAIFRIASITKPITAVAVLMLVDDGVLALDAPIAEWLPELASPSVVRTPAGPLDDVVPARRLITVEDVLSSRAGWGFPSDFSLPAIAPLLQQVQRYLLRPQDAPAPDEWLADLARIPLLYQPGEAWLYNTCSDIQGVLAARASGTSLPELLAERLFEPLGMVDTGFALPSAKLERLVTSYSPSPDGGFVRGEPVADQWGWVPAFASGAGGLVSTAADWLAFGRMLLDGGESGGRRYLSPESLRLLTTDHLTAEQRAASTLFLEGQGWGYGGSVDVDASDPWTVPGRYGWVGGSGTAAHVTPATGTVTILLTQLAMTGPTPTQLMRDVWVAAR